MKIKNMENKYFILGIVFLFLTGCSNNTYYFLDEETIINDSLTSLNYTWSSYKINNAINSGSSYEYIFLDSIYFFNTTTLQTISGINNSFSFNVIENKRYIVEGYLYGTWDVNGDFRFKLDCSGVCNGRYSIQNVEGAVDVVLNNDVATGSIAVSTGSDMMNFRSVLLPLSNQTINIQIRSNTGGFEQSILKHSYILYYEVE